MSTITPFSEVKTIRTNSVLKAPQVNTNKPNNLILTTPLLFKMLENQQQIIDGLMTVTSLMMLFII